MRPVREACGETGMGAKVGLLAEPALSPPKPSPMPSRVGLRGLWYPSFTPERLPRFGIIKASPPVPSSRV